MKYNVENRKIGLELIESGSHPTVKVVDYYYQKKYYPCAMMIYDAGIV